MHIDTNYSLPSPLIHKLHRARWLNPMHRILITFFWICDMWWCVNKWASQAEEILFHCVHPEMLKTTIIQDVTHIIPNNIKQYQNTYIYMYLNQLPNRFTNMVQPMLPNYQLPKRRKTLWRTHSSLARDSGLARRAMGQCCGTGCATMLRWCSHCWQSIANNPLSKKPWYCI